MEFYRDAVALSYVVIGLWLSILMVWCTGIITQSIERSEQNILSRLGQLEAALLTKKENEPHAEHPN